MVKKGIILCALGLLAVLAGCSDNSSTGPASTNLAGQFGGFDASAETPAFGDPTLAALAGDETAFNDPLAASPVLDSVVDTAEAGAYHFRVVWGQLRFDSTHTTPTNWDGSLTISRGGMLLRRIIRFEARTDSILPRTDLKEISWASTTTVASDGIVADLFVPRADSADTAGVTVTFATGPYTRVFTLAELLRLDTIISLPDSNQIAFNAFRFERVPCPRGFVNGFWGFDSTGQGVFRGVWRTHHGDLRGYVRGEFGADSAGNRVFYGKWINKAGNFEGLLKGLWRPMADMRADSTAYRRSGGMFLGGIYDANAHLIGVLGGHYLSTAGQRPGVFEARWKVGCLSAGPDDGLRRERMGDGMMGGGMMGGR